METKLIAGVPHKKVPCQECDEFIWVNVRCFAPYCTDCLPEIKNEYEVEHLSDYATYHDYQYHGSYVE